MAMKSAVARSKRTKAEVQEEFEKIKEEIQKEKLEFNPKAAESARQREEEVHQALKEITSEGLVQRIAGLGLEVTKTLSELSSKLTVENNLLTTLREAAAVEKAEIEKLHKIDVSTTALDQLIEEHQEKKTALEAEVVAARSEWERENAEHIQEQKEFEENLKKIRQREKDEYEYQKNAERKKEQDAFQETLRLQDRQNKEKQEALEKTWQAREQSLKTREDELTSLRKEVADFPEKIKKETEKNVMEAIKGLEIEHRQAILVLQKDSESDKRLSELKIRSLEEIVARQAKEIDSLGQRLDEAKKQVQDIAVKAIEGASGANALSHINKIAMEQAKVRSPQS